MNNVYDEMKAQQKAYDEVDATPAQAGIGGASLYASPSDVLGCEESVTSKLQRKLRGAEADHAKNRHALDILTRHPEFEEFLWLLRANVL